MAKPVVDFLEAVEVDDGQRQITAIARQPRHLVAPQFVEGAQVVGAGQEVRRRQRFEAPFERLAFRDVDDHANDAIGFAARILENRLVEDHVARSAVGMAHPRLVGLRAAAREVFDVGKLVGAGQFAGRDLVDRLADDAGSRKPEIVLEGLVAGHIVPVPVLDEERDRQRIHRRLQA